MIGNVFLFDLAPIGGGAGMLAAAVFLVVFLAIAFVAYKILRKSVKMAVRMLIVAIILTIAVAGSASLWMLSSAGSKRPQQRPRALQSR